MLLTRALSLDWRHVHTGIIIHTHTHTGSITDRHTDTHRVHHRQTDMHTQGPSHTYSHTDTHTGSITDRHRQIAPISGKAYLSDNSKWNSLSLMRQTLVFWHRWVSKKQTNPNMRYGTYFQPATQLTGAKFAMGRAPLNSLQKMTEPGRREAEGRKLGCWCFAVLELPGWVWESLLRGTAVSGLQGGTWVAWLNQTSYGGEVWKFVLWQQLMCVHMYARRHLCV